MNILYDNIVYGLQKIGGISSYWYELTKRFLETEGVSMNFFETGTEYENILRQELHLKPEMISVSKRGSMLIERFRRLNVSRFNDDSIFHSSYLRVPEKDSSVKRVCTIHDFTHDIYFKGPRAYFHNFAKKRAIIESDAIITVSEHTKKDLLHFYPNINESKIHVIYNGVSDKFNFLNFKLDANIPFLLYVGARDNYKNFKFAVNLLTVLNDYHLNIVGGALTINEKQLLDSQIKNRYSLFTNISTDNLNLLYNQSVCLLYPSSYEGFGIPLLEAMRAGCPFIALNASSIPEVAGDAGILLSELDLYEAKEAVERIVTSRSSFIDKGSKQVLKFSWNRCYKETYKLYSDL